HAVRPLARPGPLGAGAPRGGGRPLGDAVGRRQQPRHAGAGRRGDLHRGIAVGPVRHLRAPRLPPHPEDQVRVERPMTGRGGGGGAVLIELAVRDLGVIAELRLVLGRGMTAVTGETGAGKTMVVDAIELLVGGRADPMLVRTGADEAWVEGRFVLPGGDDEVVLSRAVPRSGRSRAYVDGRLATAGGPPGVGAPPGPPAPQSLLHAAAQREALDRFGGVDTGPLRRARAEVQAVADALAAMGGDERARARELDLVRYQVDEIAGAAITGPDEDEALEAEEDALADAPAHREAASQALAALSGDGDGGAAGGPASAADAV